MMGFSLLEYLQAKGHLGAKTRVLDVGSQNLMNCSLEAMYGLAAKFGPISAQQRSDIERQLYFSVPRPGEQTLFAGEYLNTIGVDYHGIDVCPAPFTEIVDLNWQRVPPEKRGHYDLVLNLGTTEHVIDQTNSHAYIHDSTRVGGVMFHQPPSIGWPNHGYFTYHPQFYYDLAVANDYQILDIWYSQSSGGETFDPAVPHRPATDPLADALTVEPTARAPYYNLNIVMRKTVDKPFRSKLELATSHSSVDQTTGHAYGQGMDIVALHDQEALKAYLKTVDVQDDGENGLPGSLGDIKRSLEVIVDRHVSSSRHSLWSGLSKQLHDVTQPLSAQIYSVQLGVDRVEAAVSGPTLLRRIRRLLGRIARRVLGR